MINSINSLKDNTDDLTEIVHKHSLRIVIGRWSDGKGEESTTIDIVQNSGNGIYAKLFCDDPNYSVANKTIILVLNGNHYTRTTDGNGKTSKLDINLDAGSYLLTAFRGGYGGVYATSDQKIINVL